MHDENDERRAGDLRHVLDLLADVNEGDGRRRLDGLPEGHALAPLHQHLNVLLDSFDRERHRSAAYRDQIEELSTAVEALRATVRDISTPIIEVANGTLCLPLLGTIEEAACEATLDELLLRVSERRAHHVILDVTAARIMGAGTARWLVRVAGAVRLLGAACTLTGVTPALATLLARSDLELSGVVTRASVRDALVSSPART